MPRCSLILIFVLVLLSIRCYPQTQSNDNRLRDIVKQFGQAEVTIPYNDNKTLDRITRKVSILSVSKEMVDISLSPLTVEWFILQKFNYSIKERVGSKGVISALNVTQAIQWNTYPTYSQYDSIMQSFKDQYPSLCRLDTIGTSINGRLILALKISDNAGVDEDEPEVFYTSTMHGDETGGFVLMLRLADYLLKNYSSDSRVKNLVDNLQIWINPLSNPDGTYATGNAITSPTRYNANGVDLNRNFPDPLQPLVTQEKENIEMINFMRKHKFVLSANFHSGSELVNYPWDRWLEMIHADDTWFHSVSRAYADTAHFYAPGGYMTDENNGVTRGAEWYVIYGGRQDFVTWELQGREVTIELDNQYITPAAQLPLLWQYNWHSLLGYLENALFGIHGIVLNASSSAPVKAEAYIEGHDRDSSQVYSDKLTGSFVRLIAPGLWFVTFSAPGYHNLTVSNIRVNNLKRTDIVVQMIPFINPFDSANLATPVLYPNPATNIINAVLPEGFSGTMNIRIINQTGMLMSDYNSEAVSGIPVQIDVRRLSGGAYSVIFTNTAAKTSTRARFIVIK